MNKIQVFFLIGLLGTIGSVSAMDRTYYQVLGIQPNATSGQIKRGYLDLSKAKHPDKIQEITGKPANAEQTAEFTQISTAYAVLKDQQLKNAYDDALKRGLTHTQAEAAARKKEEDLRNMEWEKTKAEDEKTEEERLNRVVTYLVEARSKKAVQEAEPLYEIFFREAQPLTTIPGQHYEEVKLILEAYTELIRNFQKENNHPKVTDWIKKANVFIESEKRSDLWKNNISEYQKLKDAFDRGIQSIVSPAKKTEEEKAARLKGYLAEAEYKPAREAQILYEKYLREMQPMSNDPIQYGTQVIRVLQVYREILSKFAHDTNLSAELVLAKVTEILEKVENFIKAQKTTAIWKQVAPVLEPEVDKITNWFKSLKSSVVESPEEILKREQAELLKRKQEDAAKRQQDEAAKRQQDEAAKRQQDEAAKRQQDEAVKRQQEEARKRQQEENIKRQQEEARKRQQDETIKRQQEEIAKRQQAETMRRQQEAQQRQQAEAIRQQEEQRRQETAKRQEEALRRQQEEQQLRLDDIERQRADASRQEYVRMTDEMRRIGKSLKGGLKPTLETHLIKLDIALEHLVQALHNG